MLAHGLLGFDEFKIIPGNILPGIHYWRGITEALRQNGIEVIIASVPPSGSVEERALKLGQDIAAKANGKKVNIPSFQVKSGDVVTVKDKTQANTHVEGAWQTAGGRGRPTWISTTDKDLSITISALPKREDIDATINEQLIVELYSK